MAKPDWPTAAPFVPEQGSLTELREAVQGCRGCPLWEPATQAVFGRGDTGARLVLVGEQPGDVEDREGKPFVGPAGHLLVAALDEAGADRDSVWVTNAVKHFKFTVRGKRRIHAPPDLYEVAACVPWLTAELARLQPRVVVLLGATAGKAVHGPGFRVTRSRGVLQAWPDSALLQPWPPGTERPDVLATIHPSAVLRAGDDRPAAFAGLVADLRAAAAAAAAAG